MDAKIRKTPKPKNGNYKQYAKAKKTVIKSTPMFFFYQKSRGWQFMKASWIGIAVLLSMSLFTAAEIKCEFQLSSNNVGLHESVSIIGEATGSEFDSNTKVEVNCNALNIEPFVGLPTSATSTAYSASYYPFKARCGFLGVSQDTTYQITATLLPQNIACASLGSNQVTVRATSSSQKTMVQTTIEPTAQKQVSTTYDEYGRITSSETIQQPASPAVTTTVCGDLNQRPCEKKTNNWMFPVTYVCNPPYANNGAYPLEKARCVSCQQGTKYDSGRCVIDYGKPSVTPQATPVPTPKIRPSPTPFPTVNPTPTPTPGPSLSTTPPTNIPFINGGETSYAYRLKKGWNVIGLPWDQGSTSFSCSMSNVNQIRFYSYSKSSKQWQAETSTSPVNLRGSALAVFTPVNCDYSISQPRLVQEQSLSLWNGWNLISVQTSGFTFGSSFRVKNECTITGGPWRFDNDQKKYERDQVLQPGIGYWIEVKEPFCNLAVAGGEKQPPSFP